MRHIYSRNDGEDTCDMYPVQAYVHYFRDIRKPSKRYPYGMCAWRVLCIRSYISLGHAWKTNTQRKSHQIGCQISLLIVGWDPRANSQRTGIAYGTARGAHGTQCRILYASHRQSLFRREGHPANSEQTASESIRPQTISARGKSCHCAHWLRCSKTVAFFSTSFTV